MSNKAMLQTALTPYKEKSETLKKQNEVLLTLLQEIFNLTALPHQKDKLTMIRDCNNVVDIIQKNTEIKGISTLKQCEEIEKENNK